MSTSYGKVADFNINPGIANKNSEYSDNSKKESSKDPWKHRSAEMKCWTCMYYVPKVSNIEVATIKIGRCRRSAPTMKGYPVVYPDDWCGEHKLDETKLLCG